MPSNKDYARQRVEDMLARRRMRRMDNENMPLVEKVMREKGMTLPRLPRLPKIKGRLDDITAAV